MQQAQEAYKKELANDKAGTFGTFRGRGRGRMVYDNEEGMDDEVRMTYRPSWKKLKRRKIE